MYFVSSNNFVKENLSVIACSLNDWQDGVLVNFRAKMAIDFVVSDARFRIQFELSVEE